MEKDTIPSQWGSQDREQGSLLVPSPGGPWAVVMAVVTARAGFNSSQPAAYQCACLARNGKSQLQANMHPIHIPGAGETWLPVHCQLCTFSVHAR